MKALLLLVSILALGCSKRENEHVLVSPNGRISIRVAEMDSGVAYQVGLDGKVVIRLSSLGFALNQNGQDFLSGLKLVGVEEATIDEAYAIPVGKRRQCRNLANQKSWVFKNGSGNRIRIVFRAYNDGIAFRYKLENPSPDVVAREVSTFNIGNECKAWVHGQTVNYEEKYKELKTGELGSGKYIFPALVETPEHVWMLFTDASVFENYPAAQFTATEEGELAIHLPDHENSADALGDVDEIFVGEGFESPWRVAIVGNSLHTIVESILVQNLNPPSRIADESWIAPGVSAFPWWSDFFANDSKETMMKFVDMAVEMEWEYVEFDTGLIGNDGWRTSGKWKGIGFIQEVVDYANSKGIGIIGWDERQASDTPGKRRELYRLYREMGIKGIKLDYLNGDKQRTMAYMANAVSEAAEHRLMVSFHGCPTPKGMVRTYPNIMTYEAVKGGETYQFSDNHPTPKHNCTLPFTRNVVGSMDFTPCSYSAANRSTTYAHETALPFVFESGWTCMADSPESYLNSPAKPLLKKLSAAWDELKFMDGYPGQYCCLARRSGNDWVVAGINADSAREIPIDFSFLNPGTYTGILYSDSDDPETKLQIDTFKITPATKLGIHMDANGGFVLDIANAAGEAGF